MSKYHGRPALRVAETQGRGLGALRADSMDLTIDFSKAPELADVGEAAAESAIPRLKEMLAGLERRAAGRRP